MPNRITFPRQAYRLPEKTRKGLFLYQKVGEILNKRFLMLIILALTLLVAGCAPQAPAASPSTPPASQQAQSAPPTEALTPATPAPDTSAAPAEQDDTEQEYMPAPDFTLTDMDGNTHSLSDYQGEIVILNFWASWCGPCEKEMPEYDQMNQELLETEEARLLTINLTDGVRETEDSARNFMEKNGYSMTTLLDIDGTAADAYQVYGIPTTVIINQEGRVAGYQASALTKDDVLSFIRNMP